MSGNDQDISSRLTLDTREFGSGIDIATRKLDKFLRDADQANNMVRKFGAGLDQIGRVDMAVAGASAGSVVTAGTGADSFFSYLQSRFETLFHQLAGMVDAMFGGVASGVSGGRQGVAASVSGEQQSAARAVAREHRNVARVVKVEVMFRRGLLHALTLTAQLFAGLAIVTKFLITTFPRFGAAFKRAAINFATGVKRMLGGIVRFGLALAPLIIGLIGIGLVIGVLIAAITLAAGLMLFGFLRIKKAAERVAKAERERGKVTEYSSRLIIAQEATVERQQKITRLLDSIAVAMAPLKTVLDRTITAMIPDPDKAISIFDKFADGLAIANDVLGMFISGLRIGLSVFLVAVISLVDMIPGANTAFKKLTEASLSGVIDEIAKGIEKDSQNVRDVLSGKFATLEAARKVRQEAKDRAANEKGGVGAVDRTAEAMVAGSAEAANVIALAQTEQMIVPVQQQIALQQQQLEQQRLMAATMRSINRRMDTIEQNAEIIGNEARLAGAGAVA